jgi:hypothetical protein
MQDDKPDLKNDAPAASPVTIAAEAHPAGKLPSEEPRSAAQQAQDRIDEMAKTTEYKVDEALRQAARAQPPARKAGRRSHSAKR